MDADLFDGLDSARFVKTFNNTSDSLNTMTTAGMYRIGSSNADRPGTQTYGNVLTVRGNSSDTYGQLYFSYENPGYVYARSGRISDIADHG